MIKGVEKKCGWTQSNSLHLDVGNREMVSCSFYLHIYVGKNGSKDQKPELWIGISIKQSSDKRFFIDQPIFFFQYF